MLPLFLHYICIHFPLHSILVFYNKVKIHIILTTKMSTSMLPIKAAGVRACATTTTHRKAEVSKGKVSTSKWWGPIFGWSTEPDYIVDTNEENKKSIDPDPKNKNVMFGSGSDIKVSGKPRFAPGAFTEEKARQLRMMTTETTAFHDAMYHSSIASKLASDFPKY